MLTNNNTPLRRYTMSTENPLGNIEAKFLNVYYVPQPNVSKILTLGREKKT